MSWPAWGSAQQASPVPSHSHPQSRMLSRMHYSPNSLRSQHSARPVMDCTGACRTISERRLMAVWRTPSGLATVRPLHREARTKATPQMMALAWMAQGGVALMVAEVRFLCSAFPT